MLSVKVDRNPILSIRNSVNRGPTSFLIKMYHSQPEANYNDDAREATNNIYVCKTTYLQCLCMWSHVPTVSMYMKLGTYNFYVCEGTNNVCIFNSANKKLFKGGFQLHQTPFFDDDDRNANSYL